jgi:hypothetical protein
MHVSMLAGGKLLLACKLMQSKPSAMHKSLRRL